MVVEFKRIIECGVSSRVRTVTVLVATVVAQDVSVRLCQLIHALVGVTVVEHFRVAHHAESGYAERVSFCQTEIQARSGEHTSAAVGLDTFLRQMALDESRVQLLAARAVQVVAVGHTSAVADMVTVAYVEIAVHRTGIEIDVKSYVSSRRRGPRLGQRVVDTCLYGTVETRSTVFFHH